MRYLAVLLVLLLAARPPPLTGEAALRQDIAVLADDSLAGRAPGTQGGHRTIAYLIRRFQEVGLKPGLPGGEWRQGVDVGGRSSANVVGKVVGIRQAEEAVR